MKIQKTLLLFIAIIFFLLPINLTNASINLTVSPIKEEIETQTWTIITKIAKITNHTNETLHIYTWKSDFEPNWTNWKPKFIRKSELVNPDQQLSEWIDINIAEFDLAPAETKEVEYVITIPDNATPGWHYWAIFFKNNNSESSAWNAVSINVDYWVLILITVDWEIITEAEIQDPIIWLNSGWWGWTITKDICPLWDLSRSYYDGICINTPTEIINEITWKNIDNNETSWSWSDEEKDFNISFEIPIKNIWNTHIKPSWKIILIDEDWNELKEIWKEIITNDKWAIIWEKIVDYIPINDFWGNILPGSERKYQCDWNWFWYKTYDSSWNEIIKYWDPSTYYTKKNVEDRWFLMFWERVWERQQNKKLTAIFDISYSDKNWELVEYNSAKDFYIDYTEEYIGLNPYVLIPIFALFLAFIVLWIIAILKRKKCPACNKRVKKDMKVCPYCGEKLKKLKKNKNIKKS